MKSPSHKTILRLKEAINAMPNFKGCRIGYQGNQQSLMLDTGDIYSVNYSIIIIIEEVENDLGFATKNITNEMEVQKAELILNKTVVGAELVGAGLSCGLTILSGAAVLGSLAAEVPSAGVSTIVLVAAWTGLATQSVQCLNGIIRTVEASINPNDNSLQRWDSYGWYSNTILILDAAGVISSVTSLGFAAKNIMKFLILKGALPSEAILLRMTNAERVAAYRLAIKRISTNPKVATEFDNILKQLSGRISNRLRNDNSVIIRRAAGQVSKLVSVHTTRELLKQAKEVILNTTGVVASAMPQKYIGSASGVLNWSGKQSSSYVINVITNN